MEQVEHSGTQARNTKGRAWVFTWNNYDEKDVLYLIDKLKTGSYLFGEEIGSTGTRHLQGVFRWKNPRSFKAMRKLFKENHIEMCKNWCASLNYCSKDGKTYTNIKKKQTRIERLLKRYDDIIWKDWQAEVIGICQSDRNDRVINWYYEEEGNVGKSFLAKYLVMKYQAIIADGKKDNIFNQIKLWIDNHKDDEDPKVIILDIPRHSRDYVNYGVIEQIKNGMIYSGKYEGGVCLFESPHIIVFSNSMPLESKFSVDRWNIVNIPMGSKG